MVIMHRSWMRFILFAFLIDQLFFFFVGFSYPVFGLGDESAPCEFAVQFLHDSLAYFSLS
jgi:hypothetical protein